MSESGEESELIQQLKSLQEQAGGLIEKCRFSSSSRLYGELRRRARSEQRAHEYVIGTFFQMDQAQYLMDFQTMRERAVELIALLEEEEKIRQIQSDFPRDQYEYLVHSMSSCAYENLAEATGQLEGYNSEGMHSCIADGLQICRRTGKTGCINCFREYACDVYLAADDPDIAAHQCRLVMDQDGNWSDRGDRRWLATGKLAWLEILHGHSANALGIIEEALTFCDGESVSLKFEAQMRTLLLRDTILAAAGMELQLPDSPLFADMPTREECPVFAHSLDLNQALYLVGKGRHSDAEEKLTYWDHRLQQCHGTHLWFETRLRLIALKRISGDERQAESLARPLEQRARKANDYLTLRRLQCLMDSSEPAALAVAAASKTPSGIEKAPVSPATESTASAEPDISSEKQNDPAALLSGSEGDPDGSSGRLSARINELRERMSDLMQEPTSEKFDSLRCDVLALDASVVRHSDEAASILHLMGYLVGAADDGEAIWKWANTLAAPHRENAVILSLLGTLGDNLRTSGNEQLAERITVERTEQLFRKSLELDPTRPGNFLRAGVHFLEENNAGEAERCFARAFRLDRVDGNIVRRLADLYNNTDRPKDALHVLDLSLREGCTDSQVAFDAAMLAFRMKQYDATLTYLFKFEQQEGNVLWTDYYRGVCYYEQGAYEEAISCIDREEALAETTGWHLEVMRAVICLHLHDRSQAAGHLDYVMSTPLHDIDYLSPMGLSELLQRLAQAVEEVLNDRNLINRIESRLLRSGLMPEAWFQWQRESGDQEAVEGIRLYRCLIHQPLDENWNADPDRLSDQEDWESYITEWGVLAQSEEQAREMALEYQAMCSDLPCEIQEVLASEESYTDVPGAVWQGARYPLGDDDDSDDEDDDDDPLSSTDRNNTDDPGR